MTQDGEKPIVMQACFRPDGRITAVAAKDTENPQREKQGHLLQWHKDTENLQRLQATE